MTHHIQSYIKLQRNTQKGNTKSSEGYSQLQIGMSHHFQDFTRTHKLPTRKPTEDKLVSF